MWFVLVSLAWAQEPSALTEGQEPAPASSPLAWGADLLARGHYGAAFAALDEVAWSRGPGGTGDVAAWLAGEALLRQGRTSHAVEHYAHMASRGSPEAAAWFALGEAEAAYTLGELDRAAGLLAPLTTPGPAADVARYRLAWVELRRDDVVAAEALLDQVGGPLAEPARAFQADLAGPPPERRSPGVAAVLSGVVPGAGQLYTGQPRQAVGSFVVTGALAGAGAWLATQERWPAAVPVLGVASVAWTAGVVSALTGAARYNNLQARERTVAREAAWELELVVDPEASHLAVGGRVGR